MKTLEDIIRDSASRGSLNYLSVLPKDGGWEVTYRGVDDRDARFVVHADPVCALVAALTGKAPTAPEKSVRRRPRAPRAVAPQPPAFDDLLG